MSDQDLIIKGHYRQVAQQYGTSSRSTMEDNTIRTKEVQLILDFFTLLDMQSLQTLDLGCGNGYTLSLLSNTHPHRYWGLDYSEEMIAIAQERNLPDCMFQQGDARALPFDDEFFDVVYTERCVINILDWEEQKVALSEINRVLKAGGYYLAIEAFTDGLDNCNKARDECGLSAIPPAHHNRYFEKEQFLKFIAGGVFDVISPSEFDANQGEALVPVNFLSSHYFIARVLHALVSQGEQIKNTEFVKFFSFLPPMGNYASVQAYILKKPGVE